MKITQIDTENDIKSQNFPVFKIFEQLFSKNLTDFMNWSVEKGQQRNNVLSSRLFRKVYCRFSSENTSNCHRNDKKPRFFNFQCFYPFQVEVSTDFVDWNVLESQQ